MKLGDPPNFPNIDEKWYYCHLCGGSHTDAVNLLTNGTFDSVTTGWTAGNNATLTSTTGGRFDTNCLTITGNGTNYPSAYQTVAVSASTGHKLEYWSKRGTEYWYRVRAYDATNSEDIVSTGWLKGHPDWHHGWFRFYTPATCVSCTVYLESQSLSGEAKTFLYEDVALYAEYGSSAPMYPKSMTVLADEDGHRYCNDHYQFRFYRRAMDEVEIDITDDLD